MLNKDFKEFIGLLHSNGVEFLIVGAHALAAHGRPRYTGDIDIWVRPRSENIDRLIAALDAFGFGSLGISAQDFAEPQAMVQLGYPPARIDLLTTIDGVAFAEAYEHRSTFDAGGTALPVISIDDLIRNKLATGRSKDLTTVSDSQMPRFRFAASRLHPAQRV